MGLRVWFSDRGMPAEGTDGAAHPGQACEGGGRERCPRKWLLSPVEGGPDLPSIPTCLFLSLGRLQGVTYGVCRDSQTRQRVPLSKLPFLTVPSSHLAPIPFYKISRLKIHWSGPLYRDKEVEKSKDCSTVAWLVLAEPGDPDLLGPNATFPHHVLHGTACEAN